jgi:hypothetical protein
MAWVALALTAETVIFILAGFSWFRFRGYTFAEAGAGAILALFMALSLIHQLSCYLGSPLPGFILESIALVTLLLLGLNRRPWTHLSRAARAVLLLGRQETFSGLILMTAWSGMAALTIPLLHGPLSDVHPWEGWMTGSLCAAPLFSLNIQALFYHTGRFGLAPGASGVGLLAHMAVGFSTYALARRYAWPPMALTVTLLVLSMPRLVFLGIRPTPELVSAAAITFSLVLLYRLVEQHRPGDLLLYLLCILFSIGTDPMSLGLALILLLLLVVVMIRRHGWIMWREMLAAKPHRTALAVVPILALAQLPVFILNVVHGHPLLGSPNAVVDNGLLGGAANLIRYLLISIDVTEPVRQGALLLAGVDLKDLLTGVYTFSAARLGDHTPGSLAFTPVFSGSGPMGFGPFIPLFLLPAMVHAFLRGPRRLKALGVAWGGYLYLAALMVAWQPDGLGVLTPLYAASGFVVAFSLPPHRLRRRGMRLLQTLSALLVAFSLYLSS